MSPAFKYAALPAGSAALVLARWLMQGTSNMWSKFSAQLYVPDDDLGWRRTEESFAWLGLDALLMLVLLALGVLVLVHLLAKDGRVRPSMQRILWPLLAMSLLVPIYAFASGLPKGARETQAGLGIEAPRGGIEASLRGAPAGRYQIVEHPDSAISAQLLAGGETFEARFAGGLEGTWVADPGDLSQPMHATISVRADSIKTGIDLRNQHALEDLKPATYPTIDFALRRLGSTRADGDKISFAAEGEFTLGGRTHLAQLTGRMQKVEPELRSKLKLGAGTYLLVQAQFTLDIRETIIGNDGTFDKDRVPVNVTLILKHTELPI